MLAAQHEDAPFGQYKANDNHDERISVANCIALKEGLHEEGVSKSECISVTNCQKLYRVNYRMLVAQHNEILILLDLIMTIAMQFCCIGKCSRSSRNNNEEAQEHWIMSHDHLLRALGRRANLKYKKIGPILASDHNEHQMHFTFSIPDGVQSVQKEGAVVCFYKMNEIFRDQGFDAEITTAGL